MKSCSLIPVHYLLLKSITRLYQKTASIMNIIFLNVREANRLTWQDPTECERFVRRTELPFLCIVPSPCCRAPAKWVQDLARKTKYQPSIPVSSSKEKNVSRDFGSDDEIFNKPHRELSVSLCYIKLDLIIPFVTAVAHFDVILP